MDMKIYDIQFSNFQDQVASVDSVGNLAGAKLGFNGPLLCQGNPILG